MHLVGMQYQLISNAKLERDLLRKDSLYRDPEEQVIAPRNMIKDRVGGSTDIR